MQWRQNCHVCRQTFALQRWAWARRILFSKRSFNIEIVSHSHGVRFDIFLNTVSFFMFDHRTLHWLHWSPWNLLKHPIKKALTRVMDFQLVTSICHMREIRISFASDRRANQNTILYWNCSHFTCEEHKKLRLHLCMGNLFLGQYQPNFSMERTSVQVQLAERKSLAEIRLHTFGRFLPLCAGRWILQWNSSSQTQLRHRKYETLHFVWIQNNYSLFTFPLIK